MEPAWISEGRRGDLEDRALAREKLPRLGIGPEKSGAIAWEDVHQEW
ncbi:MAG: hypothetical protein AB1894_27625 [Chloroflexota bacterium]